MEKSSLSPSWSCSDSAIQAPSALFAVLMFCPWRSAPPNSILAKGMLASTSKFLPVKVMVSCALPVAVAVRVAVTIIISVVSVSRPAPSLAVNHAIIAAHRSCDNGGPVALDGA